MKPYGDYVNPFSVFLDGLFFTVLGEGGSDLERGRKSFERVAAMVPENPFVRADLDAAASAAEGKAPEGVTYVIFETGTAAAREQVRVDIPTFVVSSRMPYVGAAFPKLKFNEAYVPSLGVKAGETTVNTATVASMDSVIANDFKNEWPYHRHQDGDHHRHQGHHRRRRAEGRGGSRWHVGRARRRPDHGWHQLRHQHRRHPHLDLPAQGVPVCPPRHAGEPRAHPRRRRRAKDRCPGTRRG
jgi:hypothetical protein